MTEPNSTATDGASTRPRPRMIGSAVFFFGMLVVMALWELVAPRRALTVSKAVRWANNLGIVFFNSFLLRLLFPAAAVGVAAFAVEYLNMSLVYKFHGLIINRGSELIRDKLICG